MRAFSTLLVPLTALALVGPGGCGGDSPRRPVGAVCTANGQCESGICGGGFCLDPEGDEDGDGLINRIEAALGTDPVVADTDGDGKPDAVEVGDDPSAPIDTDGDGKIDAIESALEDVDGDCIPDELDANDAFSDLPSDAFPDACGNGRPFPDPGTGDAVCASLKAAFGGSCALPLAVALVDCFDPAGCMTFEEDGDDNLRVTWENGAAQDVDPVTGAVRFISAAGQVCVEMEAEGGGEDEEVYVYRIEEQRWVITMGEAGEVEITCPSGARVQVGAREEAAIAACQDTSGYTLCGPIRPGACVDRGDCGAGEVCCDLGDLRMCLPASSCPS